jgi:hypothetical protein
MSDQDVIILQQIYEEMQMLLNGNMRLEHNQRRVKELTAMYNGLKEDLRPSNAQKVARDKFDEP